MKQNWAYFIQNDVKLKSSYKMHGQSYSSIICKVLEIRGLFMNYPDFPKMFPDVIESLPVLNFWADRCRKTELKMSSCLRSNNFFAILFCSIFKIFLSGLVFFWLGRDWIGCLLFFITLSSATVRVDADE